MDRDIKVALVGNPNVGKSSLFNALTGMRQHTGNWPGKTVDVATGVHDHGGVRFSLTDLPGCYSLTPHSPEEEVTRDYLFRRDSDVTVVVCDVSLLERNLILALQVIDICPRVVVVLNLIDEAKRHGVSVDTAKLQEILGVPVVCTSAKNGTGINTLADTIMHTSPRETNDSVEDTESYVTRAERISSTVLKRCGGAVHTNSIDRLLTSRFVGIPFMLCILCFIMWLTVEGANYPSQALSRFFTWLGNILHYGLDCTKLPAVMVSCLMDGVYPVTTRVISVMLPPMAIFFPLFTILEDLGYLPRAAFNLDRLFRGCGSCGKQALTMCMGLGCNAAGVTGCRIIDSERERKIAILTNSLVPCNGRFPGIICLISVFFAGSAAEASVYLTLAVSFAVGMTLLVSRILSGTLYRGTPSSFALELPPYRIPKIGEVIVRSVFDRTLFVLGRAVSVAVPAGLIIWLVSNINAGDTTILGQLSKALDPIGRFLGLDGVILSAFILGLPANEIVLPLAEAGYSASGILAESGAAEMGNLLRSMGWDSWTAAAFIGFSMFHFPCSTTLLTIKKETGSTGMTILAAVLPTLCGIVVCVVLKAFKWIT